MKKFLIPLIFSGLFLHYLTSTAQDARIFLQTALSKSGDWSKVKTIEYSTKGKNFNKWQNYSFQHPKPMADEAFRAFDFIASSYFIKTVSRYGGGYVFEFVNIGKDTTRYQYDVLRSRTGRELQTGGKRAFDAGLQFINETFPFYSIRTLIQSVDSLSMQNDSTVRRLLPNNAYEDFVFMPSGILSRITRWQTGLATDKLFSDYVRIEGIEYPKTVTQLTNNTLTRIDEVASITINQPFKKRLLDIPSEYKRSGAASSSMKATEIATDIFVIENITGGRNVLFVNMDDYIVATEAPLNAEVSQSIIDLIHKTVPGKPIRYVHLSHFHNDHSSGIGAFLKEGATLLATAPTVYAMKSIVQDSSRLQYHAIRKEHILKDRRHEVRFYEIANTHAEGMSFLYLPKEQIIFEGDLYSLPDDGTVTPAIQITEDFARFIKKKGLKVQRIVGHHGSANISMEVLEKAISMN